MAGHGWLKAIDVIGRVVAIGAGVEQDETNWDKGMHAVVLDVVENDPEVWNVRLDFRPFMDTNMPLMKPTYYNSHHHPCMTAIEANAWQDIDTWHLPPPGSAWATRLLPGPRWRKAANGVRIDAKGRRYASVFATEEEAQLWRIQANTLNLNAIRHLSNQSGFLGHSHTIAA